MIKKFERTIIIEAICFLDTKESFDEIRAWVGDNFYYDYQNCPWVFLDNSNSNCNPVRENDWVVKKDGKFSVMTSAQMKNFTEMAAVIKAIFRED